MRISIDTKYINAFSLMKTSISECVCACSASWRWFLIVLIEIASPGDKEILIVMENALSHFDVVGASRWKNVIRRIMSKRISFYIKMVPKDSRTHLIYF